VGERKPGCPSAPRSIKSDLVNGAHARAGGADGEAVGCFGIEEAGGQERHDQAWVERALWI